VCLGAATGDETAAANEAGRCRAGNPARARMAARTCEHRSCKGSRDVRGSAVWEENWAEGPYGGGKEAGATSSSAGGAVTHASSMRRLTMGASHSWICSNEPRRQRPWEEK